MDSHLGIEDVLSTTRVVRNVSISSSLSSPRSRMLLTCRHDGLYALVYQLRFMREHSQEGIVGCLGFTELADDLLD